MPVIGKSTDSVEHHQKRRAKMQQEAAENERQRIDNMSRDQLLDQIREMRNEVKEPEVRAPVPLTEGQQRQLDLEQEAGRQAVARAEAEAERNRQAAIAGAAPDPRGEKNRT